MSVRFRSSRSAWLAGLTAAALVSGLLTVVDAAPAAAGGGASLSLTKTVSSASVVPTMATTLAVDRSTAIPGDQLTYTARVTNTGAVLTLKGSYSAAEVPDNAGTLADWYDEVEYHDPATNTWASLGGYQATQSGWTPAVPSPATTGLTVATTPAAASGVTYPGTGDRVLGTQIGAGKTASWSYTAQLTLTAAQVAVLADPRRSSGIRNVVHVEVTPRDPKNGQPYIYRADFANPFAAGATPITGVSVAFTLPDGSTRTVDKDTVPALASIAAGASVNVPVKYTVPVPAAKGSTETDADYRARLGRNDGATLAASAVVTGSSSAGPVTAPTARASATESLPIGSVVKTGPATADAGQTAGYRLIIGNTGSAPATGLAVGDTTPDGSRADISTAPANLAPGATTSLSAEYAIPASQPDGPLTDTADFSWRDANHNLYGPVLSSFTTTVASSYAGAALTLTPQVAGPDVAGTSQQLTATLVDASDNPIAGKTVSFAATGANTASGSAVTDSQGHAAFSYSGTQDGTDTVQASLSLGSTHLQSNTASVSWVTPTVTVSTTSVKGQFFSGACGYFCHTKTDTPAFTEFFPTIDFNPPGGTVPHNISGISTGSRPFTDITTDVNGNYNGGVTAQGNGLQAGVGALFDFETVFTANYVVAKPGDVTFSFFSDDGFVFGLGGGATRVSGTLVNAPSSTAFEDYPVMGAYNDPTGPRGNQVTVHFPAAGVYPYELDYSECCGGELAMTMAANGSGVPPAGNLNLSPGSVPTQPVGHPLTMTLAAMDAGGQPVANLPVVLTVTGPNPQQVSGTTDLNGLAELTYTGEAAGQDHLQVGASLSGMPAISNIIDANWAYSVPGSSSGSAAAPPPAISASTPADGSMITKPTPVTASFTPPDGQTITRWSVAYRAVQATASTVIASGTGTPPATLATFDPTVLANGAYQIIISATTSGGGVQNATTSVAVTGQLKPGRYVTSYNDLSVPVAGIGMNVRRSYDSYDTGSGDFGPGWHVGLSNMTVRVNHTLGDGGWSLYPKQCSFFACTYAYTSSIPHYVTITYPNGHTEVFDFTPSGGTGPFYFLGASAFTPRPGTGTTSTLQVDGDTSVDYGFNGSLSGDLNGPVYDPHRFVLTTKDGHVYTLDRTLGLVAEKDASGNTVTIDSAGVHSSTGQSISYTRDPGHGNRITTITGPGGQAINYGYSTAGDLISVHYPDGLTLGHSYDADHHLTGSTGDGGRALSTAEYDSAGRVVAITDGAGNRSVLDTDVTGRQQVVHDPNGRLTVVYTYDDLGDVIKKEQVFGGQTQTSRFTYDPVGRLVDSEDPSGIHERWSYDETEGVHNGNLLSHTDGSGRTVRFSGYDAHGHAATVLDGEDHVLQTLQYDPVNGLLMQAQSPGLPPTTYNYYSNGLPRVTIDPAGRMATYEYNSSGYLISKSDSAGHTVSYGRDAAGQAIRVQDASGNVTWYSYDGSGDLTEVHRPDGTNQAYTYDQPGRVSTVTDSGGTTAYTYDDAGLVHQRTDRNGAVTTYGYDADGKLVSEVRPGNDVTSYRYDPLERLTEADNASAEVTFSYDDAGRVVSQISCASQPQHSDCPASSDATSALPRTRLDYTWGAGGEELSVTGPAGVTRYHYDTDSRLDTLTDPSGQLVSMRYGDTGQLSAMNLPNGIVDTFHFDPSGVLTGRAATLGSSTVARSDYSLDPATAQRSSLTDLDGTTTYTYQDNGWLTAATHPATSGLGTESFNYNGAGNRTAWTDTPAAAVTYNPAGQLATAGSMGFSYDSEGNMTSKVDASSGARTTYHWNADHQLTSVDLPDGSTSRYRYDPLGRRVETVDGTKVIRYAYDGFNLVGSYDGTNALQNSYVTLPTGADTGSTAAPADVLELRHAGATRYYLHDGSSSTTALTDEAGAVTVRYRYSAFGVPAFDIGSDIAYTYTGAPYDATTGLYYLNDRYYDPALGRFLSQDPPTQQQYEPPLGRWTHRLPPTDVTHPLTLSPYGYAGNDPIDYSDPSGDGPKARLVGAFCAVGIALADVGASYLPGSAESQAEIAELAEHCVREVDEFFEAQEAKEVAIRLAQADAREVAAELLLAAGRQIVIVIRITIRFLFFD